MVKNVVPFPLPFLKYLENTPSSFLVNSGDLFDDTLKVSPLESCPPSCPSSSSNADDNLDDSQERLFGLSLRLGFKETKNKLRLHKSLEEYLHIHLDCFPNSFDSHSSWDFGSIRGGLVGGTTAIVFRRTGSDGSSTEAFSGLVTFTVGNCVGA